MHSTEESEASAEQQFRARAKSGRRVWTGKQESNRARPSKL